MGGQLRFEFGDLGTHDVLAMIKNPRNRYINAVANAQLLCCEVNETNWGLGSCWHCAVSPA